MRILNITHTPRGPNMKRINITYTPSGPSFKLLIPTKPIKGWKEGIKDFDYFLSGFVHISISVSLSFITHTPRGPTHWWIVANFGNSGRGMCLCRGWGVPPCGGVEIWECHVPSSQIKL